MRVLSVIFLFLCSFCLKGQQCRTLSGTTVDAITHQPLPYASISLKEATIGTISNEAGIFTFHIPAPAQKDTIMVSYLGYEMFQLALDHSPDTLVASLQPATNELEEITVSPLTPFDYINRIRQHIADNYATVPFETVAYYRERVKENGNDVAHSEAVFQSYHPGSNTPAPNQHQIVLLRQADHLQKPKFVDGWLLRQAQKQEEKTIGNDDEHTLDETSIDFGGPQTILSFDLTKHEQTFLSEKEKGNYRYQVGESAMWQGKMMRKIYFETKKNVDQTKHSGYFLVDPESYAVGLVESEGEYIIPLVLRPLLLLAGITVTEPRYTLRVAYEKRGETWYPKDFHGRINLQIEERKLFRKNKSGTIEIQQVFFVNKTDVAGIVPIPPLLQYTPDKSMNSQVYGDGKTHWQDINVLSH